MAIAGMLSGFVLVFLFAVIEPFHLGADDQLTWNLFERHLRALPLAYAPLGLMSARVGICHLWRHLQR